MDIKNLCFDENMSNCYLVNILDKTYLVDASVSVNVIKQYAKKIDGVLITHGHIDHICYLKDIKEAFKCKVYCHKNAIEKIENNRLNYSRSFGINVNLKLDEYNIIREGDKIDNIFKVVETPGHTNCSVCYVCDGVMFTGDMLFSGSIGRTDLYSGSNKEMDDSILKLCRIEGDFEVYPGHGEKTRLGIEKRNNPYF